MRQSRVLLLAAVIVGLSGSRPAVAALPSPTAKLTRSFFGVTVDGPALARDGHLTEAPAIQRSGTRSVRAAVYWSELEPQEGRLELAPLDTLVLDAARAGLQVLPVVQRTPKWAAKEPGSAGSPPLTASTYARFLTRLVARYGPKGTLWTEHPEVQRRPLRAWQVWNEPELRVYWDEHDWSPGYDKLLRAAHDALKRADPGSTVITAGLTNQSWLDLRVMYYHGARGSFDAVAVHPYTAKPAGVLELARRMRATMHAWGDGAKPLLITEMGWSSGRGVSTFNYGWETTEAGQADRLRQAVPLLTAHRKELRLAGLYWYTWMSPPPGQRDSFGYTGLRRILPDGITGVDKPALAAWTSVLARLTPGG